MAQPGDSYASSLSTASPTYRTAQSTSDPPRFRRPGNAGIPGRLVRRLSSPSIPPAVYHYAKPRILGPCVLWALCLWMIHHYLLPLPLPSLPRRIQSAAKGDDHFLSSAFPPPPLRDGDDSLDSVDPRWRPLSPLAPPDAPFPRLRPTRLRRAAWSSGLRTARCCAARRSSVPRKNWDAIWLWVNGSDHRWRDSMVHWRAEEGIYSPEHHFRWVDCGGPG